MEICRIAGLRSWFTGPIFVKFAFRKSSKSVNQLLEQLLNAQYLFPNQCPASPNESVCQNTKSHLGKWIAGRDTPDMKTLTKCPPLAIGLIICVSNATMFPCWGNWPPVCTIVDAALHVVRRRNPHTERAAWVSMDNYDATIGNPTFTQFFTSFSWLNSFHLFCWI